MPSHRREPEGAIMIDRIFFAALTFCLLIAGTLAIGAAMFGEARVASAEARVVQLERVVVVGKRMAASAVAQAVATQPATRPGA
jgi:hypothetical protein